MNEPATWERLVFFFGQSVSGGLSLRTFDFMLNALLASQEEEVMLLRTNDAKLDRLLNADAMAAATHLRYSLLPDREKSAKVSDIQRARDLFVRAVSQTTSGLESAITRRNIAVCARALGDSSVVRSELSLASADADQWLEALASGAAEPVRKQNHLHRQTNAFYYGGKFALIPGLFVVIVAPAVFVAAAGAYGYAYYRKIKEAGAAYDEVVHQKELTMAFRHHIMKLQAADVDGVAG